MGPAALGLLLRSAYIYIYVCVYGKMQNYTNACTGTLIEACATIKVTRDATIKATRHGYTKAFCVVFTHAIKWALIKNRLPEQLFHLAFYTSNLYFIFYIYSHNSYFYTMVIHTNDKNTEVY